MWHPDENFQEEDDGDAQDENVTPTPQQTTGKDETTSNPSENAIIETATTGTVARGILKSASYETCTSTETPPLAPPPTATVTDHPNRRRENDFFRNTFTPDNRARTPLGPILLPPPQTQQQQQHESPQPQASTAEVIADTANDKSNEKSSSDHAIANTDETGSIKVTFCAPPPSAPPASAPLASPEQLQKYSCRRESLDDMPIDSDTFPAPPASAPYASAPLASPERLQKYSCRRESLDDMPIDSDTLLPIDLSSSAETESLIMTATRKSATGSLAQQQQLYSQLQAPQSTILLPSSDSDGYLTSAIATSPAFDIEEDDKRDYTKDTTSIAIPSDEDTDKLSLLTGPEIQPSYSCDTDAEDVETGLDRGRREDDTESINLRTVSKFELNSTKSSRSVLFGEDLVSVGTASRVSFSDSDIVLYQNCSSHHVVGDEEERYSYSPASDSFEDVELQTHEDGRLIYHKSGGSSRILTRLKTIGGPTDNDDHAPGLANKFSRNSMTSTTKKLVQATPMAVSKMIHHVGQWTQKEVAPVARKASIKATGILHHYRPPPSPRTRNMSDLNYLQSIHKAKVEKLTDIEHEDHFDFALVLTPQQAYSYWADLLDFRVEQLGEEAAQAIDDSMALIPDDYKNRYNDDGSTTTVQNENNSIAVSQSKLSTAIIHHIDTMASTSSDGTPDKSISSSSGSDHGGFHDDETTSMSPDKAQEPVLQETKQLTPPATIHDFSTPAPFHNFSTPATGMHRRRGNCKSVNSADSGSTTTATPEALVLRTAPRPRTFSLCSPYRVATSTQKSVIPRTSLFERALGPPVAFTPLNRLSDAYGFLRHPTSHNNSYEVENTPSTAFSTTTAPATLINRRRWGPHSLNGALQTPNCMMSPPIRSLSHGGSSSVLVNITKRTISAPRHRASTANFSVPEERDGEVSDDETTPGGPRRKHRNSLRIEDIPSQVIPRGIAARTNGMLQFLSALKRGVVVRRHRSGMEPVFCKIVSNDGGDTISFDFVETEDAMNAFKEQRVRYNRNSSGHAVTSRSIAQPWSYPEDTDEDSVFQNHNFSVPDFIAAKQFRDKMQRERAFSRKVTDVVTKATKSGQFRASDMVAVHPARHEDPRSDKGELGTATLRRSKATFSTPLAFSVVCRVGQRLPGASSKGIDSFENKWYKGEGNDVQFRYIDFEAATEGEYWLIFRGFLLLHRDAASGRFAAQRTAGIGSHVNRLELEQREQADLDNQNTLHRDEFFEPVTPGCMERTIVKLRKLDTTYMEGCVEPGAVPPPSDYFLGFRSPGTQIWSRLRQAGLETHRVYNVDTRSVMIKIRCPEDRLMDVAEVLRLKLKTREGSFSPFREDSMDQFRPMSDFDLEAQACPSHIAGLFRSSHRQTIIDFIIGSRIRDSGAELGQTTDLGKMICARVPLHVPKKLDNLYEAWCFFWHKENWLGRDGCSLRIERDTSISEKKSEDSCHSSELDLSVLEEHVPNRVYRFFIGSFFQPLDSIEEYFGEKVAFYFAWLQHCSCHLLVLTGVGVIVFALQLISQSWDHPIRPYFAVFIMLWSFMVLINWRKRSNYLAYRWGTIDYKEQETTRPQFKGKYVVDPITQEWVVKYPKWKRLLKCLISFPLTLLFTFGSLLIILLFHANRDLQMANYLEQKSNPNAEPFQFTFSLSAIGKTGPMRDVQITGELMMDTTFLMIVVGLPSILGLSLPLLNFILMNVSYVLNDFENYRTHSEYRTNLIIKVFSFRFVCYFASLYYYAFMSIGSKQMIENGIFRVGTGVLIYTTVAQWWTLFLQIYFPLLIYKIRMKLRRKRLLKELAAVEMEEEELFKNPITSKDSEHCKVKQLRLVNKRLLLDQAQDDMWLQCLKAPHDSFPEYITAVVQFAYVTCFSVVLPVTPLIVLINHLVSMRLDAYKVCKVRRRPLSEKTGGIGVWEHLLHIVVVISVLTNCWLMGFTHYNFLWIGDELGNIGQFAFVVCFEHVFLLIKYILHATASQMPRSLSEQIRKEKYIQERSRNMAFQKKRRTQFQRANSTRTSLRSSLTNEQSILRSDDEKGIESRIGEF